MRNFTHRILCSLTTQMSWVLAFQLKYIQTRVQASGRLQYNSILGARSWRRVGAVWTGIFFSCLNAEQYKAYNSGYVVGNAVLDDVCEHFATQAKKAYTDGILSASLGNFYLVFVGLEGDLPAQARIYRLRRNFGCAPNCMCPWCDANDSTVPYTDCRDCARWRSTVHASRPWDTEGPLLHIPGGNDEIILAKDLFHLCHLGTVRGFVVNTLCYLVSIRMFVSGWHLLIFFCDV